MKPLTLNLTVTGGTSILGIVFKLFERGSKLPIIEMTKDASFSHEFNLKDNTEYDLYIIGSNPIVDDRRTVIKLECDNFTFDPTSDRNPVIRTGKAYLVTYSFNTN